LPEKVKVTFRNHSHHNIALFRNNLQLVNWSDVLVGDTDQQTTKFSDTLNELYNRTFPVCCKFLSIKRIKKPWLTSGIIKSVKTKSYLFKLWKLGFISKHHYVKYRNKLTSIVRQSKINYHNRAFNSNRNNVKKTWSLIKNILGTRPRESIKGILLDNELITDEVHMANIFNKYFSSVANELNSSIPVSHSCPMSYLNDNVLPSFFVTPTTPNEISVIIANIKSTSSGYNSIPAVVFKKIGDLICRPISTIINSSFSNGVFPSELKRATIIPIPKSGNLQDKSNYRPISILPILSKIFERCMYNRLIKFIDKFSILTSFQFGFRKGKSTTDAILNFTNYMNKCFNNNEYSLGIFVDLRKAFDTVNHDILLNKLCIYGVRGIALQWFQSYLYGRSHCVKLGSVFSDMETVNIGVPQGSILGPLLFLIYINDMPNVSKIFSFTLFADDTTLANSNCNFAELINSTNVELNKIYDWTMSNRLSINYDKTFAFFLE